MFYAVGWIIGEGQGCGEQVEDFCLDMWGPYISGITRHFPEAQMTFDKFHIQKLLNDAVDEVRRQERKEHPELNRTRYLWLKRPEKLTKKEREILESLTPRKRHLKTSRAYAIKLSFQEFWELPLSPRIIPSALNHNELHVFCRFLL